MFPARGKHGSKMIIFLSTTALAGRELSRIHLYGPQVRPWENIFVCGGILADTEILKNGCGHGLALATAHAAANSCMEYIR